MRSSLTQTPPTTTTTKNSLKQTNKKTTEDLRGERIQKTSEKRGDSIHNAIPLTHNSQHKLRNSLSLCWSWTPILWPPYPKNWLTRKDPDARKDWRHEEKGTTEDEMVGWWHHRLNGHEFEQALGVGVGQGSLACCSPWDCRVTHAWVTELNFILKLAFWQHPSLSHAKCFNSRPGIILPLLLGRKAKRKYFWGKKGNLTFYLSLNSRF